MRMSFHQQQIVEQENCQNLGPVDTYPFCLKSKFLFTYTPYVHMYPMKTLTENATF